MDPSISDRELLRLAFENAAALRRGVIATALSSRPALAFFGPGVSVIGGERLKVGRGVRVGERVLLNARGGEIELGENVSLGAFSRLVVSTSIRDPSGFIRIGPNVGIGEFAYVGGAGGVEIGADTIVGQYLSLHPENHVFSDREKPIRLQGVTRKGIRIGSNCWIGAKVTVLDGVSVGNDSVIAAGAVVTKSFPEGSVIGGVPARLLKRRA
ncbi:MAG: acyltransferase [Myxococcaceae bacterium]|nr:acyltransferase [Myxococcaceae bacterium]